MDIIRDPAELQRICLGWRESGDRIGFVPTMGYFHAGHLALMDAAKARAKRLVVSLFVNPTQFGPTEDLAAYPRDFERDAALAAEHGADVLFAPEREAMYQGPDVWVDVPQVAAHLCGASRPGHFRGVATVVAKLLLLVQPHVAVFGEKDRQQLAVIRAMSRQLFLNVDIEGHPIVREADGLAMSSRNVYLTAAERAVAPNIYQGLLFARERIMAGERDAARLAQALREFYAAHVPEGRVDYATFVDTETMAPVTAVTGPVVLAVAVYLGKARLIDNLLIEP